MDRKNVLILGAGCDQLSMFKEAVDLGLGIYALDGRAEAEGKECADHFEQCDIKNPDEVEKIALRLNKEVGIDGVITPAVEVGPSVGRVVDILGLPGIPEKTALTLTDKILRRVALDEAKITQPKWAYREEKRAGLWNTFPCVVKPRDKAGALGVKIAYNMGEIGTGYDLLEEYLEGYEISTEVLFLPTGHVAVSADRNYNKKLKWAPYLLEDGCQLPATVSERIQRKVDTLIFNIKKYFKLSGYAIKLDLLIKDNQIYVIEIAPRLGGGKLSSLMIPKYCGVNWWKLALQLAMNLPFEIKTSPEFIPVAQRYVFKDNPKSHYDRITDFIETGSTIEEAIKKAEDKVKNWK